MMFVPRDTGVTDYTENMGNILGPEGLPKDLNWHVCSSKYLKQCKPYLLPQSGDAALLMSGRQLLYLIYVWYD
jgi:hypothetical protein